MKETRTMEQWLTAATSGIRFRPDREAVEEELRGHFEDKVADLQRVFHISAEEAEEMALERMGDPRQIGVELAKIHRPWLGYLLRASRVALGLSIMLLFIGGGFFGSGVPYRGVEEEPERPTFSSQEVLNLGQYEFRVEEAYIEDTEDWEDGEKKLTVFWKATSARFWEKPGYLPGYYWRGEDDTGKRYSSYGDGFYGYDRYRGDAITWEHPEEDGLGWVFEQTVPNVPEDMTWIKLSYDHAGVAGTLLLEREVEP